MDFLKKFWPFSFRAKDVSNLIISLLIYVVIYVVCGLVIGLLDFIPVIGLILGTVCLSIFGSAFNAVYLLPKFAELYGMPLDTIIAMGSEIHSGIHNVTTFVMLCVAPLNVVKGAMVSVLTLLLYKRVARPLFGIHK